MNNNSIIIRGARQHNLKNIDVTLPRNQLIVITGLSGSGKSTLAFDTLYAEGQRRYVESLSAYARQFLERMEKPDADLIEGLSPAIAIEQKTASHNPRSTVATVTEIYDYLRLLYARVGTPYCYRCNQPITQQTIDQIIDSVMTLPENTKIIILAPVVSDQKGTHEKLLSGLKKQGFARVRINGEILELETIKALDKKGMYSIDVVVDRLIVKTSIVKRLADSVELAMSQSDGVVIVDVLSGPPMVFSDKPRCLTCGISYPPFTPSHFSFNSPSGACPKCDGLGATTEFDPELIVPNPDLSLREGAVVMWANRSSVYFVEFLEALTRHYQADIFTPYHKLPQAFKKVLMYGSGDDRISFFIERNNRRHTYEKTFEGLIPSLQRRYLETESSPAREDIKRYMNFKVCPECHGARLNTESRHVRINELNISEITALSIEKARLFIQSIDLSGKNKKIADRIVKEIGDRLGFLENVGLDYMTLDRSAATLSGGESQRIRLATQIGSKLSGVLYVLDEPSIGLHQKDNQRLFQTLLKMRDLGNTVLLVEHDEYTIRASDYVVDMGPGAGVHGGQVVFSGKPADMLLDDKSLTGQYLSGRKKIEVPAFRRTNPDHCLSIRGARGNNLQSIDVRFPLGCLTCVTGVSGSGKSTLVLETLYRALTQKLHHARIQSKAYDNITGLEQVDKIVHIDQSPIGKTPRSNPGTYTGVFTHIRELFSKTPDAKMRGFRSGRFSFNVKGGRCEACTGDGTIKIEMHFLPDVYVTCDICRGTRYNRETLDIRYKGKNIADVLNMTVNQSLAFFKNIESIRSKLSMLVEVGLGYICIGQSATTLSGGEAQRVKLARELSKKGTGRTVYVLDEPTTGLHVDDIKRLMHVLNQLVEAGNTVIVIEHNLDVIKSADYVIDLGPDGGDKGGQVVGCGTPEQIAQIPESYTGQYLKTILL